MQRHAAWRTETGPLARAVTMPATDEIECTLPPLTLSAAYVLLYLVSHDLWHLIEYSAEGHAGYLAEAGT